jgi:hypothetical protein
MVIRSAAQVGSERSGSNELAAGEVSQKVGANGGISAMLVRSAYRFGALQMKIFSGYRERARWYILPPTF